MQPWLYSPHANVETVKRMTNRDRIRKWLGLNDDYLLCQDRIDKWVERVTALESTNRQLNDELTTLKSAVRRLTAPARSIPVYHDFESAQVAALDEFKEK